MVSPIFANFSSVRLEFFSVLLFEVHPSLTLYLHSEVSFKLNKKNNFKSFKYRSNFSIESNLELHKILQYTKIIEKIYRHQRW